MRSGTGTVPGPVQNRCLSTPRDQSMKIGPRMLVMGVLSVACAASVQAATADVPTRVKALNGLLAEQWQHTLETSPEFATILGDLRYNDRWSDASLAKQQVEYAKTKD